ncbi:thioredoxin reductase [Paenibacillus sp. FSL H8-0548]|uniref:NAD(P)/FAD-dependent oxidoreductase n=1 Tax=Paenibacillus sp. FSL H8-0548 TaxID=1920422 RepID=UPI00096FF028|nr:NAD(P)/FAD-dependent oxidoreductase [Paenibacillus sp. FSL H8-0548]OMF23240.1 thioredoxin reductase [Paenibacillus sp. FSL H8-0548]
MNESIDIYDVTIIGGGPAGMYTAFYSGMRDLKTKLIEASDQLGGRMLLYPEKLIWDVGGITPIRCEVLIRQLEQQAKTFDPTIVLGQEIISTEKQPDGTFLLTSATGEQHYSRTIILTVGYGINKPVKLDIEGVERYEVGNLHYTVQELNIFRGKHVLISGGGDSAVDWANELEPLAASVTIVHRREKFSGHEKSVATMKQSSVTIAAPYVIKSLYSSNGAEINKVEIAHTETSESKLIEVDAVIVNHGMEADYNALTLWGLKAGEWEMKVGTRMETSIPGIYAAGDFVTYESKVKLIAGAFTDGVLALNSVKLYLDPEAPKVAYVSSHNERFKEKNKALGVVEEE